MSICDKKNKAQTIKELLKSASQEEKDAIVKKEISDYLSFFPLLSENNRSKEGIETYLKNLFAIFCVYLPVLIGVLLINVGLGFSLGLAGLVIVAVLNYFILRLIVNRNNFFSRINLDVFKDEDLVVDIFSLFLASKFSQNLEKEYKDLKLEYLEHYLNMKDKKAIVAEMRELIESMLLYHKS